MFKRVLFVTALLCLVTFSYSQKVDIDNYRVEMEVANLPGKFIDADKRTFHVEVSGPAGIVSKIKKDQLKLYGFNQVDKDGTLKLSINVSDMVRGDVGKSTRVDEQKDKAGKVISSTTYYTYSSTNSANTNLTIYGPMSEKEKLEEEAKQKEEEAKKKAKEKPVAENKFLKNATNATTTVDAADKNESNVYKKIKSFGLGTSYTHKGSESASATAAYDSYKTGQSAAFDNAVNRYPDDVISLSYDNVNTLYGYYPIKLTYQKMKILDSDKHPEHNTFKQATEAAKIIFKNFKYDSEIETFKQDFAPILEYFNTLAAKLGTKEKPERKLKAAALYNAAMINFSLDNLDESEKICKEMILMDQDKDDAEDLVKKIKEVREDLAKHKMTTRHIKEVK